MIARNPPSRYSRKTSMLVAAGLRLDESIYPSHCHMPRHGHGPASVSFIMCGEFEETIGSSRFRRRVSDLIFHAPEKEHAVRFGAEPAKIFRVEFGPEWTERIGLASRAFARPGGRLAGADGLMARLRSETHEPDTLSAMTIEGLVLELIAAGARAASRAGVREPAWLAQVRERLHDGLIEAPSIAELAAEAGISPAHLCRAFRARHGTTIGAYLRRLRVEHAARSLRPGEAPLARIALESGFADQSHFTRAFRRHFGVTPLEYRRNISG